MERFLQRTGYAEDQILVSFARLIGDQFFGENRDILVNDESVEYRAPLVAAMIGSFLEGSEATDQNERGRLRALILAEHEKTLSALKQLFTEAHIGSAIVGSEEEAKEAEGRLCSETVVAMPASLFLAAVEDGCFKPRDFGFVIIEGADIFSEQPSEVQRKIWGHLLPPWERRTALFAEHIGIRAKNTAIDFARNPKTIVLKKAQASLSAISTSMYRVSSEKKFRVLLSLIQEERQRGRKAVVVFCNLRQTSREVEARLRLNHIHAEHVSAAAPKVNNEALLRRFSELAGSEKERGGYEEREHLVFVVSNDNLEVLPSEFAPVGIHYDIPLDADVYLERVRTMHLRNATMVGLVCERYEVGLSAITSRFGIQFELKEPSAEMQECRDASEGVSLDLERDHPADRQTPPRRNEWRASEAPPGGSNRRNRHNQESRRPRSKHTKRSHRAPALHNSDETGQDQSLYSMSTEERLAYFRNKYRNILKTPIQPLPQQNSTPKTNETAQDNREPDNNSIVKRLIGKFMSGGKGSGQDREEH